MIKKWIFFLIAMNATMVFARVTSSIKNEEGDPSSSKLCFQEDNKPEVCITFANEEMKKVRVLNYLMANNFLSLKRAPQTILTVHTI